MGIQLTYQELEPVLDAEGVPVVPLECGNDCCVYALWSGRHLLTFLTGVAGFMDTRFPAESKRITSAEHFKLLVQTEKNKRS